MCDDFISIDLKNFRLGYQLIMFGGHLNRARSKKNYF